MKKKAEVEVKTKNPLANGSFNEKAARDVIKLIKNCGHGYNPPRMSTANLCGFPHIRLDLGQIWENPSKAGG